ncbi:MAG: hypothetical protein WDO06_02755 [Actinomycetota bacterium]
MHPERPTDRRIQLVLNFLLVSVLREDQVLVKVRQDLQIFAADEAPFVNISGEFLVVYGLVEAKEVLSDSEEIKSKITRYAQMAAHPYMRSFTTDLASRMGLPSVVLGFLRAEKSCPIPLPSEKNYSLFLIPVRILRDDKIHVKRRNIRVLARADLNKRKWET